MSAIGITPAVCYVPAHGGKSVHKLTNQSSLRLAFKVKSSDNGHYIVDRVYGFVEVGSETPITVTRTKPGKAKADKLVIHFADVPADLTDPKAAFEPGYNQSTLIGEIVLKISAAE